MSAKQKKISELADAVEVICHRKRNASLKFFLAKAQVFPALTSPILYRIRKAMAEHVISLRTTGANYDLWEPRSAVDTRARREERKVLQSSKKTLKRTDNVPSNQAYLRLLQSAVSAARLCCVTQGQLCSLAVVDTLRCMAH